MSATRSREQQGKAVEALLPIAFAGFHRGMLSFTKAPITMDITEKRVRFSGPESSVDMEVMSGFGGKPVQIKNLPNPAYQDYTQYKSIAHTHASDKATWSHSGTNGFTSTMEAGSKPLRSSRSAVLYYQYPAAFPAAIGRPIRPAASRRR